MAFVGCQVEGCASHLHQIYQGGYVAMIEINLDITERKICRDCVEKLRVWGNTGKFKKVEHSTVYMTYKSEEDE